MFLLLKRIRAWRTDMLLTGDFTALELDELEDHLEAEANHLVQDEGYSDENAFYEALRRLGAPGELVQEFRAEHEISRRHPVLPTLLRSLHWLTSAGRKLLVFCLPSIAVAASGFALVPFYKTLYEDMGTALPTSTSVLFSAPSLFSQFGFIVMVIALLLFILALPSAIRAKQLRNAHRLSVPDFVSEELESVHGWLIAGVFFYPILGRFFVGILFGPLAEFLDKM